MVVQRLGNLSSASTDFTVNQYRKISFGNTADKLEDFLHCRRLTDNLVFLFLLNRSIHESVAVSLANQLQHVNSVNCGSSDNSNCLVDIKRFWQVFK